MAVGKRRTLSRTTIDGMDPMPSADTAVVWAGRHVLGDLEDSVDSPNTCVVDAKNG